MKDIKKIGKLISFAVASVAMPLLAFAQTGGAGPAQQPSGYSTPPQSTINTTQLVLNNICAVFDWMFYFLIALAVIFIVIAAYRYLTASGNPEKVKGATNTIIYAAIAVAVALLAQAVPLVVAEFLGANTGSGIGNCGAGSSGSGGSISV
jgi:uncharacterized membrane protein